MRVCCVMVAAGVFVAPGDAAEVLAGSERLPSRIEEEWFAANANLQDQVVRVQRLALEAGIENLEPAARALVRGGARADVMQRTRLAVSLAPDLPFAHMARAQALWGAGRIPAAIAAVGAAVAAIPRHLEASLWLGGSLLWILGVVFVAGPLVFIGVLSLRKLPHATHDLGDLFSLQMPTYARGALLASMLLLPVVLGEGLLGLALGLFAVGVAYSGTRQRVVLLFAAILLVFGVFSFPRLVGSTLSSFDSDPMALSASAVFRGMGSRADIERLEQGVPGDRFAEHALAVHARGSGAGAEAGRIYAGLLARAPHDPVLLANVGNQFFREGDLDAAIRLYERAASQIESPTLLFNLAQAYARAFRMDEFETAMQAAQHLDPAHVARLSRVGAPGFVADLPVSASQIRWRLFESASGQPFARHFRSQVAPGWFGTDGLATTACFLGMWWAGIVLASRYRRSGSCRSCGTRTCLRCDEGLLEGELCGACHHLIHRPEKTDPNRRYGRISALRRREERIRGLDRAASVVVPGAGGVWATRPGRGLLAALLYVCAWLALVWRTGVVPDPLVLGGAGPLVLWSFALMMGFGYLGLVLAGWRKPGNA